MRDKQPPSKTSTRMLVFEGGCLVVVKQSTTIKTEHARARFREWLLGGGEEQPITVENERACLFSRVLGCGEPYGFCKVLN
jgi:hypothetical protein